MYEYMYIHMRTPGFVSRHVEEPELLPNNILYRMRASRLLDGFSQRNVNTELFTQHYITPSMFLSIFVYSDSAEFYGTNNERKFNIGRWQIQRHRHTKRQRIHSESKKNLNKRNAWSSDQCLGRAICHRQQQSVRVHHQHRKNIALNIALTQLLRMLCCIMHEYLYIYILHVCNGVGRLWTYWTTLGLDTQMMFANGSLAAGRFDVTLQERSSKEERQEQCGSMQLKWSHLHEKYMKDTK